MKTSEKGINLIKSFEGCRLSAYKDIGGVWTIGFGHTEGVKDGDIITEEIALSYLVKDIVVCEIQIYQLVKVHLSQGMFDALISFIFNVGKGNFQKSTLLRKLNNYDYVGASQEFQRWIYVKGKPSSGLIRRREEERKLFISNKKNNI